MIANASIHGTLREGSTNLNRFYDVPFIVMSQVIGRRNRVRPPAGFKSARAVFFASMLASILLLTGCAVYPMRTRTVGWTGIEKQLDMSFIQVSKTNKDEVADKLAWMDTGITQERFFWGRWYRSSSGAAYPVDAGGLPLPMASRTWHVRNLLVEFDEGGAVKRSGNFSDNELSGEIARWFKETGEPPLNLLPPLVLQMKGGTKSMTLAEDMVQFLLWNEQNFTVPRKDISKLELQATRWTPGDSSSAPPDVSVELFFSRERPGRKGCQCLLLDVRPADYLTLLRYTAEGATHY